MIDKISGINLEYNGSAIVDFSNNLKYQNLYKEKKHHEDLDKLVTIIRENLNNLSTNVFTRFIYNLAAK